MNDINKSSDRAASAIFLLCAMSKVRISPTKRGGFHVVPYGLVEAADGARRSLAPFLEKGIGHTR